jgi:hypothetical protein
MCWRYSNTSRIMSRLRYRFGRPDRGSQVNPRECSTTEIGQLECSASPDSVASNALQSYGISSHGVRILAVRTIANKRDAVFIRSGIRMSGICSDSGCVKTGTNRVVFGWEKEFFSFVQRTLMSFRGVRSATGSRWQSPGFRFDS